MSLINDALKRATGHETAPPETGGPMPMPMQPAVETRCGPDPKIYGGVGAAALLIIAIGGWMLKSKTAHVPLEAQTGPVVTQLQTDAAPPPPVSRAEEEPAHASTPAIVQPAAAIDSSAAEPAKSATDSATPGISEILTSAAPASVNNAEPVAEATTTRTAGEPPVLKLDAIYYRLKGPTVVINGKTLRPGQQIEGARVIVIHRSSVEVEYEGTLKTLILQ
jgi:hypothetical protein